MLERLQTAIPPGRGAKPPGPGRPTRAEAEERSQELLEKALDLFLEKGFEGTTIRDITRAVGMAKRTVVARYGNKMSLFKAALKRAIDDWVVPETRLRAVETDDLEATLRQIAKILSANYLTPASVRLARITNAESVRTPEISTYNYEQCTRPQIAYLADLLRRRSPGGAGFPAAEAYARSFLILISSPAQAIAWGVQLSEAEVESRLNHAVSLFMHGLPRPPAAP